MSRTRIPHEVDDYIIEENTKGRPEMTIFAKTLNHLLVEKSIHQDDLAQALGISSGSISSYRRGEKEPRFTMIVKIADYLGVDCHYLMTGVQAKHYAIASELGLSDAAIHELKALQNGAIFTETINNFISSDCFRQIIAFAYHFRKTMTDITNMSEDPAIEPPDIRQKFSSADLLEYYASKNLSCYFDVIKEDELSKSSTLTKESNGYQLHYRKGENR